MEGVANFKYLGQPLYQTDDDWRPVRRNIKRARRVWGILGKILRREGAEPKVVEMLYRAVTQAVLLFDSETWVLSSVTEITVEGTHNEFMRQITGNWAWWKADGPWSTPKLEEVLEVVGTHPETT